MAIRNELLGGTDFSNERLLSQDLNDTFDKIAEILNTLDNIINP